MVYTKNMYFIYIYFQDDWWYGKTSDNRFGWFNKSCATVIENNVIKDTNALSEKPGYYTDYNC